MLWSLLSFIIVGLICGAVARLLFPGKQPMTLTATAVLGMAGSLLGGLVGSAIWGGFGGLSIRPGGWILSVAGAMVLLYFWSRRR